MSATHVLDGAPSYIRDSLAQEARETFGNLMGIQASEVPESLVNLYWEAQHMANRVQSGEMDVRHMAILVLLDRFISEKAAEKKQQRTANDAAKDATSRSTKKF